MVKNVNSHKKFKSREMKMVINGSVKKRDFI